VKRLALLAAAALVLAGCGVKKETTTAAGLQPLTVMLDFFPNADHAGLYAAQARGDFKKAGLDVKLQAPNDPSEPLRLLAAGKVDLAISYEPELFLARDDDELVVGRDAGLVDADDLRVLVLALELDALVVPEPAQRRVDLLGQHRRNEVEPDVDLPDAGDARVGGDRLEVRRLVRDARRADALALQLARA